MTTTHWNGWGQTECENIYDGYKKLISQTVSVYQNIKELTQTDKDYIKSISDIHNKIKEINEKSNKLRKFTMMAHKDVEIKLTKMF
jgi:predicted  nucleic acid-binding Zn-ribbon protein